MFKFHPKTEEASTIRRYLLILSLSLSVLFTGVWLWNEYVATYATIILPGVMVVILIISLLADWIEPARIPSWYYFLLAIAILIPLLIGAFFIFLYKGQVDWLSL